MEKVDSRSNYIRTKIHLIDYWKATLKEAEEIPKEFMDLELIRKCDELRGKIRKELATLDSTGETYSSLKLERDRLLAELFEAGL